MRLTRSMKPLIIGTLIVGLAVFTYSLANAGPGRHHRGHGEGFLGGFLEEHAARLGLDEATQEEIRKIVDESREKARELRVKSYEARRGMHDLLSQDLPDESAVMQQAEMIGEIETESHKHRLGTMLQIRALLTPEQREELAKIRKESGPWKRWGKPGYGAEE